MLSKLLKYEIKATGRIFLPVFLALLIFAAITRFISAIGPEKWAAPAVISMFIYIVIMAGMFVMTFIMMIQRFHKNLLSEEGYLMLTLPVKPWKHIISKLLVAMLWIMASGISAFLSILIIALKEGDITHFVQGFAVFYDQVFKPLGTSGYLLSLEIILGVLISLASGILIIYASIAIGHLFNRHRMLASFGAFIGLNTLSQIFFLLLSLTPGIDRFSNLHISAQNFMSMLPIIHLGIALATLSTLILGIAYFAATNYILGQRLNLE